MQLFDGEQSLLESDNNTLILTSHRVRLNSNTSGRIEIISIMLDAISSCRLVRLENPLLMWLGLCFLAIGGMGIVSGRSEIGFMVVVGIVFLLIYAFTVKQVLEFASPSATIRLDARQMKHDEAKRFIDAVEKARNTRMVAAA